MGIERPPQTKAVYTKGHEVVATVLPSPVNIYVAGNGRLLLPRACEHVKGNKYTVLYVDLLRSTVVQLLLLAAIDTVQECILHCFLP